MILQNLFDFFLKMGDGRGSLPFIRERDLSFGLRKGLIFRSIDGLISFLILYLTFGLI